MKEIKLSSGTTLKISKTPFALSRSLYQAILEEMKDVKMDSNLQITNLTKEMAWVWFGSPKVEAALWECFKYCIYGELKIDKDTFEADEARNDYLDVCIEVTEHNIRPFMKGLFVGSSRLLATVFGTQK